MQLAGIYGTKAFSIYLSTPFLLELHGEKCIYYIPLKNISADNYWTM